jgi:hypothetical protein
MRRAVVFKLTCVVPATVADRRLCYVDTHGMNGAKEIRPATVLFSSPSKPEASDGREHTSYRRSGTLRVLRQAAANRERRIAALARRKRPILL